jgi:hypothetical protein
LQINIIEMDDDDGDYAKTWLFFQPDLSKYIGKAILAVPRCCQKRKGTQDRRRVKELMNRRMESEKSSKEENSPR